MLTDSFKVYARALVDLDRLMHSGQEDSDHADSLRDTMDRPWFAMSARERLLARTLSADLYELHQQPRLEDDVASEQDQHAMRDLVDHAQCQDWEYVLLNMRSVGRFMPDSFVAYIRGRAWADLGDVDLGWLFLDRACQLAPQNMNYRYLALDALSRSSRTSEAEDAAKAILAAPDEHHPKTVAKAADILFMETRMFTEDAAAHTYQQLIQIYTRLLPRLEHGADDEPLVLVQVLVLKGLCHEHLYQTEEARQCYDRAIQLDPYNEAALTARGLLLYGTDGQSLVDLEAVCKQNTPLTWPYLFLAHHFLRAGDYAKCDRYCVAALSHSPTMRAKGDLFEWRAICGYNLGASTQEVRAFFGKALQLAPTNVRIRSNVALFDRLVSQVTAQADWSLQPDDETRRVGWQEFMFRAVA